MPLKHVLLATALALPVTAFAVDGGPGRHFILNRDLDGDGHVTLAELAEKRGDVTGRNSD